MHNGNTFCLRVKRGVWVFAATNDKGKKEVRLLSEADTPIRRHIKIKADANPLDPKWYQYFRTRWAREYSAKRSGGMRMV